MVEEFASLQRGRSRAAGDVVCGDISISGGTLIIEANGDDDNRVTFVNASLNVTSDGIVTGDGVSFFITEDSGQGDHINIAANADVTLSAPTDGDMEGVLFYQDRNSPANITNGPVMLVGASSSR